MTTTSPASALADDPVARAVDADRQLWDITRPHPARWLTVRNAAVHDAIAAGRTREELAGALGVLPRDIDRILSTTWL